MNSASIAARKAGLSRHQAGPTKYSGGASPLIRSTTHVGGNSSRKSTSVATYSSRSISRTSPRGDPVGQRRVLHRVQVVDLDRVDPQPGHFAGGGHHVVVRFAGQAQHDVGTDLEAAAAAALPWRRRSASWWCPRFIQSSERSWIVCSPYSTDKISPAGDLAQQVEHVVGHAVGPRADGQPDDLRMVERLFVDAAQAGRPARRCSWPAESRPESGRPRSAI